jgi:hypothetical protein
VNVITAVALRVGRRARGSVMYWQLEGKRATSSDQLQTGL